ncbi:3-hydroxybutyrate oligomer hydrolase family protein [Streptomyces sp. NPDC007991]|uniref:3-hydroxybutyrate oligomer hydrolase family protein n=1 Tax=Streptomyces sp. NPDC007991 TaxID=3364803 RepID=UPI0036ED2C18
MSLAGAALPAATAQAGPGGGLPSFAGSVTSRTYDGRDDDLLTAGLGFAGLRRATPPAVPRRPRCGGGPYGPRRGSPGATRAGWDGCTGSEERAWACRVGQGLDATRRDGDLHGKSAPVVHGRDDTRVPVNHSSRPYLGLNSRTEHGRSALSRVEVEHAHHSDSTAPGFGNRYVPLGFSFQQALDLMWARLTEGRALPPSQVVRTVPRGGEPGRAPALTRAHVPPVPASD